MFLDSINVFFFSSLTFKAVEHLSVHERKDVILHNRADRVQSADIFINSLCQHR